MIRNTGTTHKGTAFYRAKPRQLRIGTVYKTKRTAAERIKAERAKEC